MSRAHEAEKQYRCEWCHNRFKNKNEAERHKNSLHLRKQSWSCSALAANIAVAFFSSTEILEANSTAQPPPGDPTQDLCGYCGDKFANNPTNWQERESHLDQVHKFRECNQHRKFFRADHFRQHLKHSHSGTGGKWTTRLEQACIRDEPNAPNNANEPGPSAPVANMGGLVPPEMAAAALAGPAAAAQYGLSQQAMGNLRAHHHELAQHALASQLDMSNIDPNMSTNPHLSPGGMSTAVGNLPPSQ